MGPGPGTQPPAEPAGHAHPVRVIEGFLRSGQSPPPDPETARVVPHPKEPIEYDPIHTIVSACQETGVGLAQGIHALSKITLPYWLPEGPFLPSASLGRSLCGYRFQNDKFVVDLRRDAEFAQSRPHFFAQRFIAPI